MKKRYIFTRECPSCSEKFEIELLDSDVTGFQCENCGAYYEIKTRKELEKKSIK